MTIAISGATGAIGMALINKCISEGDKVVVFVRPDSNRKSQLPVSDKIRVLEYGIENFDDLVQGNISTDDIPKIDVFYHFAWKGTIGDGRNDMDLQNMNVKYTLDAVRLANTLGAKLFIGAGSQAEYGRVEGMLTADTAVNPENGYGIAKLCAGQMSRILCEQLNMRHIWTRILSVYGPYDGELTMITSVIKKLLNGEKPALTAGLQQWDYLHSYDAANAMFLLGKTDNISGEAFVIGSGSARPLKEYIEIMRDAINPSLELGFGEIPYSDKQVMHLCADIDKLTRATGFRPSVSFEDGIRTTIEYIKDRIE